MPSWWGKSSSKNVKRKISRGSFIDAIHKKFEGGSEGKNSRKSGGSQRFTNVMVSEKEFALPRSVLTSAQVSRCQSFSEDSLAQPLPLPGSHFASLGYTDYGIYESRMELHGWSKPLLINSRHGHDADKPLASDACTALATTSVSCNSSMDIDDQHQVLSPHASNFESGNITAINCPSSKRNNDQSIVMRRILNEKWKPQNMSSNHSIPLTSTKHHGPLSTHMTKLEIPPRAGFCSDPISSISSPVRSPVRACGHDKIMSSGFCLETQCSDVNLAGSAHFSSRGPGQTSGHKSVRGELPLFSSQSRCSHECSPIASPKMSSYAPGSCIHSGSATPSHPQAGVFPTDSSLNRADDGKVHGHRLPLPPVAITPSVPSSCPTVTAPTLLKNQGRAESPTSPISHWKKGRLIGSGTFGHVYLGFNSESGKICAMKEVTLFSDDAKSKECVQQLEQEITMLSCLRHPNIVRYFGSQTVDDKLYVYLEYVSGGSILKLLREYGQLGESAIRSYTQQILCGLMYLHAKNTVHRDIKGANILVDPSGRVKLADFGMAKHITGQSCPLSFKGSPHWMAPEVVRNSNGCNLAVDIWSLGCTVIEMATAKPPWSQYEGVAALFKIGNSKELPTIPDHLSEDGKDFVRQCLQRNPLDRPTAVQLLEHPFVKNVVPLERSLQSPDLPEPLRAVTNAALYKVMGHVKTFPCLDSEGMAVQLSRGFNVGSRSSDAFMPKHVSCPVSPVGSPLLRPKSSQPTCRREASTFSSHRTASGSSTPCTGGRGALPIDTLNHSTTYTYDNVGVQRPPKSLYDSSSLLYCKPKSKTLPGTPQVTHVNREIVSSQSRLVGSQSVQLFRRDSREFSDQHPVLADHVSQRLLMDHLKLNLSPGSSVLGHTNMI